MRRLTTILVLSLLTATLVAAQTPALSYNKNFSAVSAGDRITIQSTGLGFFKLAFIPTGSPASCQVEADTSVDGVSWGSADAVASTACTTASSATGASAVFNTFIRINVTALTANTSVFVVLTGYYTNPATGTIGGTVTAIQGAAGATPWLIDLNKVGGTSTVTGGVNGSLGVGGLAADGAAVAGNPLVIGGKVTGTGVAKAFLVDSNGGLFVDQGTAPWTTQESTSTASTNALTAVELATLTASASVKASPGNVYGVSAANGAASVCWVQFVNSAGAGTLGSAVIFSVPLPASGVVNIPPATFPMSNFTTGIAAGIATTPTGGVACGTAGNVTVWFK